jgi:hypothetical protein
MSQAGNSNRRASLDDQKERAAGRRGEREMIKQAVMPRDMKGKAGGAFGSGGATSRPAPTGASSRPARKRKA